MIWLILAANAVSILCVVAAALLALSGVGWWGWFLLVAALCAVYPTKIKNLGEPVTVDVAAADGLCGRCFGKGHEHGVYERCVCPECNGSGRLPAGGE